MCRFKRALAACCTGRFYGFFVDKAIKTHDYRAAFEVCKVKNRLIGDFKSFMRKAQQTPSIKPVRLRWDRIQGSRLPFLSGTGPGLPGGVSYEGPSTV
jgi:hypothetical protein